MTEPSDEGATFGHDPGPLFGNNAQPMASSRPRYFCDRYFCDRYFYRNFLAASARRSHTCYPRRNTQLEIVMSGRESSAVEHAVAEAATAPSLSAVARRHGIAVSSLRRALRRRGLEPRKHLRGEAHAAVRQPAAS